MPNRCTFATKKKTFKRNLKPVFGPTKKSQNQMDSSQKRFNLETLMNEVNAQFHAKKNIISYFQNVTYCIKTYSLAKKKFLSFK